MEHDRPPTNADELAQTARQKRAEIIAHRAQVIDAIRHLLTAVTSDTLTQKNAQQFCSAKDTLRRAADFLSSLQPRDLRRDGMDDNYLRIVALALKAGDVEGWQERGWRQTMINVVVGLLLLFYGLNDLDCTASRGGAKALQDPAFSLLGNIFRLGRGSVDDDEDELF